MDITFADVESAVLTSLMTGDSFSKFLFWKDVPSQIRKEFANHYPCLTIDPVGDASNDGSSDPLLSIDRKCFLKLMGERCDVDTFLCSYNEPIRILAHYMVQRVAFTRFSEEVDRLRSLRIYSPYFDGAILDQELSRSCEAVLGVKEIDLEENYRLALLTELRLILLREFDHKKLLFGLTCGRDVWQSEFADAPTIEDGCEIYRQQLRLKRYGFDQLVNCQTGGGALFHFLIMEGNIGNCPINSFHYHRELMRVHREETLGLFDDYGYQPGPFLGMLNARLTPGNRFQHRDRLDRSKFDQFVFQLEDEYESEFIERLWGLYDFDQKILERGDFGFGLEPVGMPQLGGMMAQLAKSGVDLVQIFDKSNDLRSIFRACDQAVKNNLCLQVELHYDPLFPGGAKAFAAMAREILSKYLGRIKYLGVKDAPGSIEPAAAWELSSEVGNVIQELGLNLTMSFHTHDTGSRLESVLEFRRGLPEEIDLIVDHCSGPGFLAQPSLKRTLSFLGIKIPEKAQSALSVVDQIIADESTRREEAGEQQFISTSERQEIINFVQAGGSNATLYRDCKAQLSVIAASLLTKKSDLEAEDLLKPFVSAVRQELPKVNIALGCLSRVTPAMNWLQSQAIFLILHLVKKKKVSLKIDGSSIALVVQPWKASDLIATILPSWLNHLVSLTVDPVLRDLHHVLEPELAQFAVAKLDENLAGYSEWDLKAAKFDVERYGHINPDHGVLDFLNPLLAILEKDAVDLQVLQIAKGLAKCNAKPIKNKLANNFEGLTLEDIFGLASTGVSEELFLSLDDLWKKYQQEREGIDWETFLILSSFRGTLATHYQKCLQLQLDAAESDDSEVSGAALIALEAMGIESDNSVSGVAPAIANVVA